MLVRSQSKSMHNTIHLGATYHDAKYYQQLAPVNLQQNSKTKNNSESSRYKREH